MEHTENNEFEEKLTQQLEIVQKCQEDHKIESCLKCEQLLGCEIRRAYVQAVYNSMSKGETGGFEF